MKIKNKRLYLIFGMILMVVLLLSIGFSTLQRQLLIDDSIFNVRLQKDTRVSASLVTKTGGDAVSNYEDYNVSKVYGSVQFPTTSSYVLYKVDLTNYGNVKTGLLGITSNTSGVNFSVCDANGNNCSSNPKTSVCNGNNCTLGSTKEIYVKVTSTSTGTKNVDLDFDFEPYNNITYSNIRENTSSFQQEIMTNDTYVLTLTSKPEEVDITGNLTYTYNKNTGQLNISHVESDISITAKYLSTDIAESSYTGSDPDNYVLLGQELYRIVTKESIGDGYGNTELRVKLIKDSSIGNNQFDGLSNEFSGSNMDTVLNTTYLGSMPNTTKDFIDTALWTSSYANYIGLISSSDFTQNSSWLPNDGYTVTKATDNKIVAITSSGLIDSLTTVSRATHPSVYLKENAVIVSGTGSRTNPYILDLAGSGLQPNPTVITGLTVTVNGSSQELVSVTNKVGTVYFAQTRLNESNYESNGSTDIPKKTNVGDYIFYYYIPAANGFKAKTGLVNAKINGLTFIVTYTKGANVDSIGKSGDSCTTTGSSLSCNVTLPSITPSQGYENGKWNYNSNQYNPGSSFSLDSTKNGITMTATASGSTYTATFNKNGATSISSNSLSCTVTSGNSCTINASPNIVRDGYTILGWSTDQDAHTGITAGGAITLSGNTTYYAITSKTVTITFNKNGNTAQIPNGGSQSSATTVTDTCTIWNNNSTCNVTAPEIVMSGYTIHGYSTGATTYSNYWTHKTAKAVSDNATWFAQTSISERTVTITFNRNGNTSQTPKNGTASTATTITESCTIDAARNGASQATSCSITSPTIGVPSGFTVIGYSDGSNNHTSSWAVNTAKDVTENATYFAQSSSSAVERTITFYKNGNTAFTYNSTRYTDTSKSFTACTIPAVYNGATQSSSCSATITMPTIEASSGFTTIGWSTGATTYTATYTSGQANVTISMNANKSYYAQSSKAAIDRTITFYKNGNTAFTYNSNRYTDTSKTFTACTIDAVYNGATQSSSCSASLTMPTIEAASGFTTIGWSTSATTYTAAYTSGQTGVSLTMNENKSYYAQSSKAAINRTITFYKNGNTAFTYNSTRYTDTSKSFTACTIDAVYNGATQSSSCNATITMPTIEAASGFTVIGWSTAANTHTASYTGGQTGVSLTMSANRSFYAQSSKAAIDRTITFYKNGNTSFTYSGTTYTDDYKSFTLCTIDAVYNGATQNSSCSATVTFPTISAPTGYNQNGWGTTASATTPAYTSGQSSVSLTMNENKVYYAIKTIINPTTPTITGGTTNIYNYEDTTLTCSTTSTYASGTNIYYEFGYATSTANFNNNTITWLGGASTTATKIIAKNSHIGTRYYTCRVYASDGTTYTSSTVKTSSTSNIVYVNSMINFNVSSNGGTISGSSSLYVPYGMSNVYTGRTNTTAGNIPTATKSSYSFLGWYTAASGGTKVINPNGSIEKNVTNWTDSNGYWIRTSTSTSTTANVLYAQFEINDPNTPTITGGTTKVYNSSSTTLTCSTTSTYASGTNIYYEFGYSTTSNGTVTWLGSPTTTATYSVGAAAYRGSRYYTCRIYVTDGTSTSATVAASAKTTLSLVNARINFDATTNGGSLTGSSSLYVGYASSTYYTGRTNTTSGSLPTASKEGYNLSGWYNSSGNKVINADGTIVASVSNWTNASSQFILTSTTDNATTNVLTARYTGKQFTVTYYLGNGTSTAGNTAYTTTTTCTYGDSCTLATFSSLGKTFPNNGTGWGFAYWSTSQTSLTSAYTNGETFTYNINGNLNLYAVGKRTVNFVKGIAPTTIFDTKEQYWIPYSTSTTYATGVAIPSVSDVGSIGNGWSFLCFRANNVASSTCGISSTYNGTTYKIPVANSIQYRSIYSRTLTLSYNSNGGSGTMNNQTLTQYYNSGYPSGGTNTSSAISSNSFTLSNNSFTKSGYSFSKWAEGSANGTQYSAGASYTGIGTTVNDSNVSKTMYAIWSIDPINTPTITGGATKVLGHQATTLTCATTSTYSGASIYYEFGYSTTSNGTITWLGSPTTTETYSIGSYEFSGTRYYKCRVYASDGTNTTATATASTATEMTLRRARIDFDATTNGGNESTQTYYVAYNNDEIFVGATGGGPQPASLPSATKPGYTFDGWYTAASGGTRVINNQTIQSGVANWTNSSAKWILTNASDVAGTNTLYAHFTANTYTATFYYNSNTTNGSITAATTTAQCTVSGGSTCTVTVPSAVQNSVGKYNGPYHGVSTAINGMGSDSLTISENTTFYANYSRPLTIYYPNSSNGISNTNTALYRNEYFTNSSATAMSAVTSNANNSTTQADGVTLTNSKGTLTGLATTYNTTTTYALNNSSNLVNTNRATYYAVVTASENAVIHYNSNTTSESFTDATANASTTSTYYCESTSAMATTHGTTTTVPSAVQNSIGKYNSAYKGISSSDTTITNVTTFTGGSTYYAYYSSPITIYYPNTSNGISNINTALYRNEYYSSSTAMTTITANTDTSTTQATSVTLSNLKGTLSGINYTVNTNTSYAINNTTYVINRNNTTYYAVTTADENVTFKYNSNTTCGSATVATATQAVTATYRCQSTSAMYTTHGTTTTVPSAVSSSKGQYNSTYRAIANVNSLTAVTTFTGGTTYYAVYSSAITNYYYNSGYTNRTLYRNEYLASSSATTYTARLATSNTSATNISTAAGPGSSAFVGFSDGADTTAEYSIVANMASSYNGTTYTCTTGPIYNVYQFNVTYSKGANVSAIGATSASCNVTTSSTSCTVVLPTITPNSGYSSVGWSTTNGATTGDAAGSLYTVNTNPTTLYANATVANYQNTTTGEGYQTLSAAFNAVASNQTIKVMANTTETTFATLASGKTGVKLDLNGKTITSDETTVISNNGTLDIYNTSSTTGAMSGTANYLITNSGTLTINGTSSTNSVIITNNNDISMFSAILNSNGATATINDNVQILSSNACGISNSGTLNFNGGIISSYEIGINNQTTGNLYIAGGVITSSGNNAIQNQNAGKVYITGGTVSHTNGIAILLNSEGELTLGRNDSTVSTTSPVIQTTGTNNAFAISCAGCTFNFYDGVVKSSSGTGKAIYGTVNDTPTGYSVYKETVSGVESAYLVGDPYLNTSTSATYTTLNAALSAVSSNQTIKVMSNTTETTAATLASSKTGVKLDLNGKTITSSTTNAITNSGTLDIYNTSSTTGSIRGKITNNGTLTVNGTSSTRATNITTIDNSQSKSLTINNMSYLTYLNNYGTATITGGSFNGIVNAGTGTLNITNAEMESDSDGIENSGIMNITSSTVYAWIVNTEDGTLTINGSSTNIEPYGNTTAILNEGTILMHNGNVIGQNIGIQSDNGTVTIEDGSVFGYDTAIDLEDGTLTVGINDGTVSTTAPSISNDNNSRSIPVERPPAIYVEYGATFYFYDGIIESDSGNGTSIDGEVAGVPNGYSIFTSSSGNVETSILLLTSSVNYQNMTTNNTYSTLSSALTTVQSNQTIRVLNNVTENTAATLASGKTGVKLDLYGHTITYGNVGISNSGSLDIYNSLSSPGTITGGASAVIINLGTLTLNGTSSTNQVTISKTQSGTSTINNNGTLTINNNVIVNNTVNSTSDAINNTGAVTLNGGTISGPYGILNHFEGEIYISGSTAQVIGTSRYGIENFGSLSMSAGTVSSTQESGIHIINDEAYGYGSSALITGGTVTGVVNGILLEEADLTLGTKNASVSTTSPTIQTTGTSNKNGIYNYRGAFYFYDGVVKSSSGTGKAIFGTVTDTPSGYLVYKKTTNGVESAYLINTSTALLKAGDNGDENSAFLGTTILKKDIETITFTNSISGHTVNGTNCFDVSLNGNGTVLLWTTDTNSNGKYEVTIGSSVGTVYSSTCEYLFYKLINVTSISGMQYFNTSLATSMRSMFNSCISLTTVDLSYFDTSKVTSFRTMFSTTSAYGDMTIVSITGIENLDVSNATELSAMFQRCVNLLSLDLHNWDTRNLVYVNNLVYGCSSLNYINLTGWDTSKVTTMQGMFWNCPALMDLSSISTFNTSNVEDMSSMLGLGSGLEKNNGVMDISFLTNWDTSKVTDMDGFLQHVKISSFAPFYNWNVSSVENFNNMFRQPDSGSVATTLFGLEQWDTSSATNMAGMFYGYSTLTDVSAIRSFDVSHVTDMHGIFRNNSSLQVIDLANWNTSSVTNLSQMFYGCSSLKTIFVESGFVTTNVTESTNMFYGCTSLVGGAGTTYNSSYIDVGYAHADGGTSNPGYFTGVFKISFTTTNIYGNATISVSYTDNSNLASTAQRTMIAVSNTSDMYERIIRIVSGKITYSLKKVSTVKASKSDLNNTYTFRGWYSRSDGAGSQIFNASGVMQSNVSGYTTNGNWTVNGSNLTNNTLTLYPYIYKSGGGSVSSIEDPVVPSMATQMALAGVNIKNKINDIDNIVTIDEDNISSTSKFLNTSILRGEIRSVKFANSINKRKASDNNTWDISNNKDGSILLWVNNSSNGYYDITIGQDGGVIANPNSNYLFAYLYNLENIDFTNFNTSSVISMNNMFYRCDKLDNSSINNILKIISSDYELDDIGLSYNQACSSDYKKHNINPGYECD